MFQFFRRLSKEKKLLLLSFAIDLLVGVILRELSWYIAYNIDPAERKIVSEYDYSILHELRDDMIPWEILVYGSHAVNILLVLLSSYSNWFLLLASFSTYFYGNGLYIVLLSILKNVTGRLRPDFVARCKPDDLGVCTGDPDVVAEGRVSWPSGHSAMAGYAAVYSILLLNDVCKPFNKKKHYQSVRILPLIGVGLAFVITAISRNVDNHHHPGDIVCGFTLGGLVGLWAFYNRQRYKRRILAKKGEEVGLLNDEDPIESNV
ncbi:hypothetical protein GEMRC1_002258 [Eukaryota sp. GEM-RC1]